MFERYEGVLRDFFKKGEQFQVEALRTIETYWESSQFHVIFILDKLIKKELIHIKTIATYLIEKITSKNTTLEKNSVLSVDF